MKIRSALMNVVVATASLAVIGVGCDTPKTLSPSVQIATNLPLLDERIEIGEKIEDVSSIRTNPADSTQLQLHLEKDEISLGDNGEVGSDRMIVDAQPPGQSDVEVGYIEVEDVPPSTTAPVMLSMVNPAIGGLPDDSQTDTPAFTSPKRSDEYVVFDNIQRVTMSDFSSETINQLTVSVANETPLTMETVEIFLSNSSDTLATQDIYAVIEITNVADYDSVSSDPVDLSGLTVLNPTHVFTRITFEAGSDISTNELKNGYFTITVDITELEVESAIAKIPPQSFSSTRYRSFENDRLELIRVDFASVAHPDSNKYVLTFENDILTDIIIQYAIPDFYIPTKPVVTAGSGDVEQGGTDPNDWSSGVIEVPAGGGVQIAYDLDGGVLTNFDAPGQPVDDLQIDIDVHIIGTGDNQVEINASDAVKTTTGLSALALQRVEGRVPDGRPIDVAIEPFDFEIEQNTPAGLKAILPKHFLSILNLGADSLTVDVEITLVMQVVPPPGGGESAYYERLLYGQLRSDQIVPFVTTEDSIGSQGNAPLDIVQAMIQNIFDTGYGKIDVEGNVRLRGPVVLVRDESRIRGEDMLIEMPLAFEVPALTFDAKSEQSDAFDISFDEDIRDDMIPRVKGAALVANVKNHFPLGGRLVMFVSPDPRLTHLRNSFPAANEDVLSDIPDVLPGGLDIADIQQFEAANGVYALFRIDLPRPSRLADGSVDHDNPGDSTVVVALGEAQMKLFSMESVYLLPRVQLYEAPGTVQLRPDDYLDVSLWMQLKAETKK